MPFDPERLSLYPDAPGVYLMKDCNGKVLYIGKAKNVRARLKQYFGARQDERKMVPYLTKQIESIDTLLTLTEKEALLLENQLIKEHLPKYNILLKDDKAFISLILTKHEWPMLRLIRFKQMPNKDVGTCFGPYTSASAARQTFDLMCRLFPLRQCSDSEFANRQRPCLLYDIKRCLAPCVGKCTKEEYQTTLSKAVRFLKGENKEVISSLKIEMQKASDELEFEKASNLYRTIQQIEHVTEEQQVDFLEEQDSDILGIYRKVDTCLITLLLFRKGKLMGSEHFHFSPIISSDAELIESFLLQHYPGKMFQPKELILPIELDAKEALSEILQIEITTAYRGTKKRLLEMARKNAEALFIQEQDEKSLKERMLLELEDVLHLTRFPKVIECFDTSNISGTDPVASVACFVDGEKEKKRTRLFKVRGKGDDYTAMKEVLYRRFSKEKEKDSFCDLLIVDGGKGQLAVALEVFEELKIASIDVIALTKEEARHDKGLTQEKVFIPHREEPILINPKSPLLFLLQRIRDEAHGQAIRYHRKKRSERTLSSALDEIRGIGPVKKKKLLSHFKSVHQIKKATKEELEKSGILTAKDIETILRWQK